MVYTFPHLSARASATPGATRGAVVEVEVEVRDGSEDDLNREKMEKERRGVVVADGGSRPAAVAGAAGGRAGFVVGGLLVVGCLAWVVL